jgi:hypothetical protein
VFDGESFEPCPMGYPDSGAARQRLMKWARARIEAWRRRRGLPPLPPLPDMLEVEEGELETEADVPETDAA